MVDSLEQRMDQLSNQDTLKIAALLELADLEELELEERVEYAAYALRLSERMEHPLSYISSADVLTSLYYFNGEYEQAEIYAIKSVEIARHNHLDAQLANALCSLGEIEDYLGKDENSVSHILEAIEVAEDCLDYDAMVRSYISLAGYYYYRDLNAKALEYYEEAKLILVKHDEIKDRHVVMGVTESSIGWVYYYDGKMDLAIEQLKNAVNIYDTYEKNSTYASNAHASLSTLYSENADFELAQEEAQRSIDIAMINDYTVGYLNGYEALGNAYVGLKDPRRARSAFLEALDAAKRLKDIDSRLNITQSLAKVFVLEGNYEMAYDYLLGVDEIKDSIRQTEIDNAFNESITKYETEKTETENEILLQQNKIETLENKDNKAKLSQSRIIIISSVIGLLLLVGLAFVLLNRNRLKQKANAELSVAYETIQLSNEQLTNANNIIQEKNDDITASMEYASKIQEALLPTKENAELFKDSFFILMPKDIVSGDFLWYSKVGSKVIFAAADCTGHGVPGAFMSMIGNTFLHQIVNEEKVLQPSIILDQLRERVITALRQDGEDNARKDGMDMALCSLDLETRELQFAGANNPLYYTKGREIVELKGDKQPVGYMPERSGPFTNHKIVLNEGDAIYIFSDGYPDQFGGPKGKKFKYKQLRELLLSNSQKPMLSQKELLISSFYDWKGDLEQIDDVCLIGVRV
ncbi:MAG: hypothetical protein BM555_00415 [Crocinitomix sp. MedPE-SWsnd]|nr:MAG: hypothetical protein BM555_00415 [Crocinitomix sp. MedPE-SWsnd]